MYFTDTHLGVKFQLRNETSVPSLLQTEMYWPKGISVLLYTISNTIICHSRIKALEHMRNAYISSPLPAHSTNPLHFASHKLHVPFYTAYPSHSGSLSLLSHPDKTSSTLSSRKRNLSYGSTKKQSTAKIRFPPPCLSLNHKLLRNVKAPASEMLF